MIQGPAIFIVFSSLLVRMNGAAGSLTLAGIEQFREAYRLWDGGRFAAAADRFRQATTNAPGSSTNFYWLGVTEFHRMLQRRSLPDSATNAVAAEAALEAALQALRTAVTLNAKDAESHALLGTLYGMKIGDNWLRALRLGPRVAKHRDLAMASGAQNPRVRYLLGTCLFHTAKTRAGWREALSEFLAAEKLFQAEAQRPADPLAPRWGHASCLTFIGRTYELLGRNTEATVYYRKALAKHPADYLAREGLARVAPHP